MSAFCNGIWLKDQPYPTTLSARAWKDYFSRYFNQWWPKYLLSFVVPHAVHVGSQWVDTVEMARINPRLAAFYYRACAG